MRRSMRRSAKQAGTLKLIEIHREDIESLPDLMTLLRDAPYRFIVFCDDLSFDARRHVLQVAQGGARRRHRGPAGERDPLRDLEPPPPDAARHDGERALDRDQSRRGGRGEGLAVGPLRAVARLPPLQPGRIPRDGRGLRRRTSASRSSAETLRARGAGMGDDARLALGPRRLAIRAGPRGAARRPEEPSPR